MGMVLCRGKHVAAKSCLPLSGVTLAFAKAATVLGP